MLIVKCLVDGTLLLHLYQDIGMRKHYENRGKRNMCSWTVIGWLLANMVATCSEWPVVG